MSKMSFILKTYQISEIWLMFFQFTLLLKKIKLSEKFPWLRKILLISDTICSGVTHFLEENFRLQNQPMLNEKEMDDINW